MNPNSDDLSSYYTQTRAMLKKWGDFDAENIPVLLSKEQFGPKTFNDRRNCLFKFFGWLVRKGKITDNTLAEVSTKRRQRNAEAIGLQVRDELWNTGEIKICRSLARTSKGTNEAARKEKGTKTDNVRFIPMNPFLVDLLKPLCSFKRGTDLVITNEARRMIDDRMFQRRTFKPVLQELKIQDCIDPLNS